MPDPTTRYVRNRTGADVFVSGHGVVQRGFEGELPASDAVAALVGAHVFADVKPPEEKKSNTDKKEGGS